MEPIKLKQSQIVELMKDKIKANGTHKSGTYDKERDATAYEKGEASFMVELGYSMPRSNPWPECEHGYEDPPCNHCRENCLEGMYAPPPMPEVVKASYNDVTWGVEFEFETSAGKVAAYFAWPNGGNEGEWTERKRSFSSTNQPKFERVFLDVLFARSESDFRQDEEYEDWPEAE